MEEEPKQLRPTTRSLLMALTLVACILTTYRESSTTTHFALLYRRRPIDGEVVAKAENHDDTSSLQSDVPPQFMPRTVFLESSEWDHLPRLPRSIRPGNLPLQTDRSQVYDRMDSEDLPEMEQRIFPDHDLGEDCEPANEWMYLQFPNCNEFHSVDFVETLASNGVEIKSLSVLSSAGFWRTAWRYVDGQAMVSVLKTLKFNHAFEEAFIEQSRVDALVMNRMTESPHVVGVYAYCSTSVLTEYAGPHLFSSKVSLPKEGVGMLQIALHVAQGLADLHASNVAHADLNPQNVVWNEALTIPMLNDFNLSVLRFRNRQTGKLCDFTSRYPSPQWKSPEEQDIQFRLSSTVSTEDYPRLTTKVDVYSLANVLYRLATGRSPWRLEVAAVGLETKEEKKAFITKLKRNGKTPIAPDRIRKSTDIATHILLDIAESCFQYHPTARPSVREVVRRLEEEIARFPTPGNITVIAVME